MICKLEVIFLQWGLFYEIAQMCMLYIYIYIYIYILHNGLVMFKKVMKWINILRKAVNIAWEVSKYEVFSGPHSNWITPYLSVFSPNTWKYGAEKTPYLDTFHAVKSFHYLDVL